MDFKLTRNKNLLKTAIKNSLTQLKVSHLAEKQQQQHLLFKLFFSYLRSISRMLLFSIWRKKLNRLALVSLKVKL